MTSHNTHTHTHTHTQNHTHTKSHTHTHTHTHTQSYAYYMIATTTRETGHSRKPNYYCNTHYDSASSLASIHAYITCMHTHTQTHARMHTHTLTSLLHHRVRPLWHKGGINSKLYNYDIINYMQLYIIGVISESRPLEATILPDFRNERILCSAT